MVSRNRERGAPLAIRTTEGFSALYEHQSRNVLTFFVRRVLDPEVALDLTAETFAQAFLGRRGFRGSSDEEAVAWLFGVAKNQLNQYWRRGAAERRAVARLGLVVPELSDADHDRIEELAASEPLRIAAQNGLMELSESVRAALRLRVVDELPYAEVAERLTISEPAARARVSRGLRSLAGHIVDHHSTEERETGD